MIKINNASYEYKNGTIALNNINLEINNGEFVAVIGKNGSGKSTLARIITGLELPSKGEVIVNDINTRDKKKVLELRKNIGIVFQNPENQVIFSRVYDDIAFGMKNLGVDEKDIKPGIENVLKKVGMENHIYSDPYELSLGQKQRIAIASVLAMNPKIIVFDEPTTMLDPEGKVIIYDIAKNLQKEGFTIIFITNVVDEVLFADRVIVIEEGVINKEFSKKDIIDNTNIFQELGIQLPKLLEILIQLKSKGIDIDLEEFI